ncbi:Triosephosphate isomerase [Rhodovulum sp. P5]|uniref:triose-phosphate isomerase n=1 Tax=Rhodovulum sp. P5 TaxID=1564506 RepID=UPI0009C2605F|nr:triose-phosphate isomerase [Rhodovulum sp. P5]ARE41448.1 Triosephosphate isomerase [Rhodovulum sp. P5]
MRKKLAAGNWKMNGTGKSLEEVVQLSMDYMTSNIDILICPPATLIERMLHTAVDSAVAVGGQDCHAKPSGAHTGDISAEMLKDAGATYVILGHSERRTDHAETDAVVRAKTEAALAEGLVAVVCVGETEAQRDAGQTLAVIEAQLAGSLPDTGVDGKTVVVAYEPVWAIGTGRVPTLDQIAEVHDFMRAELTKRFGDDGNRIRLLYGGSVKPGNAAEIFAVSNVDGALVGGASLKAADFSAIIAALEAA